MALPFFTVQIPSDARDVLDGQDIVMVSPDGSTKTFTIMGDAPGTSAERTLMRAFLHPNARKPRSDKGGTHKASE